MPAVARLGDICTGHGCFSPRPSVEGSGDVFTNQIPTHRMGDGWAVHCCVICHGSVLAAGSPNVFVNNRPIGRLSDPVACGSVVASGSPNVFANG